MLTTPTPPTCSTNIFVPLKIINLCQKYRIRGAAMHQKCFISYTKVYDETEGSNSTQLREEAMMWPKLLRMFYLDLDQKKPRTFYPDLDLISQLPMWLNLKWSKNKYNSKKSKKYCINFVKEIEFHILLNKMTHLKKNLAAWLSICV